MRHYLHIIVEWVSSLITIFCMMAGFFRWPEINWKIVSLSFGFLGVWFVNSYLFKKRAFLRMKKNIKKTFKEEG
jgi:hypothetical protein